MVNTDIYIAIAIMTGVNFLTRMFPFLFFRKNELPKPLMYVEKYFPAVIMTILIVYSVKDISFAVAPYGFKEIAGIIVTASLHVLLKNYLISIFAGTIFYMALVQFM